MAVYVVDVTADIPYPWCRKYQQDVSSESVAVSRALKEYRRDVRNRNGQAKKITEFSIKVKRLRSTMKKEEHNDGKEN